MDDWSVDRQNAIMKFLASITDEEAHDFFTIIRKHKAQEAAGLLRFIPWTQLFEYLYKILLHIQFAVTIFAIHPADPGGKINARARYVLWQKRIMSRLDYVHSICKHLANIGTSARIEDKEPFKMFFTEAHKVTQNTVQMMEAKEEFAKLVKKTCDENRHALWVAHLPQELRDADPKIQQAFKVQPWDMYMMPGTVLNPQDSESGEASQVIPPGGVDILRDWEREVRDLQAEHAASTGRLPNSAGIRFNLHHTGATTGFRHTPNDPIQRSAGLALQPGTKFPTVR